MKHPTDFGLQWTTVTLERVKYGDKKNNNMRKPNNNQYNKIKCHFKLT